MQSSLCVKKLSSLVCKQKEGGTEETTNVGSWPLKTAPRLDHAVRRKQTAKTGKSSQENTQ